MTEIAHTISNEQLKAKVGTLLETFYKKRIEALGGLKLVDVLKRKNPYLYRATSSGNPSDWEELSGERDFYLRLVDAMEECSLVHAVVFKSEFDKAVNRFTRELLDEFADSEGQLDWRKIVAFNSSRNSPQQRKRK